MLDLQTLFFNRSPKENALLDFGFVKRDERYVYATPIVDGQFTLCVTVAPTGEVKTKVIDAAFDEEYVLHLVNEATGEFVGRVRTEYERIVGEIAAQCFTGDGVFKGDTAQAVIAYIFNRYGDELEFLWADTPDNAIVRRKDNQKWYGVFMTIPKRKLGDFDNGKIVVLNVKVPTEEIDTIVNGKNCFYGWHMNKKSWVSIPLDGTMPVNQVLKRIDISYELVKKK